MTGKTVEKWISWLFIKSNVSLPLFTVLEAQRQHHKSCLWLIVVYVHMRIAMRMSPSLKHAKGRVLPSWHIHPSDKLQLHQRSRKSQSMTSKSALSTRHEPPKSLRLSACLLSASYGMDDANWCTKAGKIITSCVGFFLAREHTVQSARFFQAPVWQPCTTQDISFGSLLDPRARPWSISFGIWWNNLRWSELWKMVALNMGPWKNERSGQGHFLEWKIHEFQVSCQTFGGNQGATGVGVLLQFEVVCRHTKLPCCGLLVENPPYLDSGWSWIHSYGVHQWFSMIVNDCHDARIESPKSFVAKPVSHPWSLTPPKRPNLKQCQVSLARYFQGPSALKASHLCLSRIVPALASPEL